MRAKHLKSSMVTFAILVAFAGGGMVSLGSNLQIPSLLAASSVEPDSSFALNAPAVSVARSQVAKNEIARAMAQPTRDVTVVENWSFTYAPYALPFTIENIQTSPQFHSYAVVVHQQDPSFPISPGQ
jgi:hypothetical protein